MREDLTRAGRPIANRPQVNNQVNNPPHGCAAVRWFTFPAVWDRHPSHHPSLRVVS
jgi:hypothetical protein